MTHLLTLLCITAALNAITTKADANAVANFIPDIVLDKIEELLKPYPESDEMIAQASLNLASNEGKAHVQMLQRNIDKPDVFKSYVLRMIDKTVEDLGNIESDVMFTDYLDKFATEKYKRSDEWKQLQSRFGPEIQRSSVSMLVPTANAMRQGVNTALVTLATQRQHEILKAIGGGLDAVKSIKFTWGFEALRNVNFKDLADAVRKGLKANRAYYKAVAQQANILKIAKWTGRAGAVLSVGLMGWDLYINVRDWYQGKIDGLQATQNVLESLAGVVAGWAAGTLVGSVAGPIGALLGGLLGGYIGSEAAHAFLNWLFQRRPEDRLTQAYDDLGLQSTATSQAIKDRYVELAKKYHPDKGGDHDQFIKVNFAYDNIRAERLVVNPHQYDL